jgi:hypothetical protein
VGCFGADAELAGRSVDTFHAQFNEAAYREIYAGGSDEFKRATKEADWVALLEAVRRKLGRVVEAKQSSIHVTTGTFGTAVNQTYSTRFTDGAATESFSWAIRNGKAILVGYRIESPQLITR